MEITLPGREPVLYGDVTPDRVAAIIDKYIRNGSPPKASSRPAPPQRCKFPIRQTSKNSAMAQFSNYILVCGGTGCRASHREHIITALRKELDEAGLSDQVQVIRTGCFGFCEQGPIVKTVPRQYLLRIGQTGRRRGHRPRTHHQGTQGGAPALCRPRHGPTRLRLQAHGVL